MTALETPLDVEAINLKKMHLYAHLRELRRRLVWVVLALAVGFGIGLGVAEPVYRLLLLPLQHALPPTATNTLIFTAVTDGFVTEMRVAWFVALVFGFPVLAWQIYAFVAPALYPGEKKWFRAYLLAAPVLFIMGAALAYVAVLRLALAFFLSFGLDAAGTAGMGSTYLGTVGAYLSFVTGLLLAFGISFQLPIVITALGRSGLVPLATLKAKRRHAVVLVLIFAAIVTPPDVISQLTLSVPLYALYEVSLLLIAVGGRRIEQKNI